MTATMRAFSIAPALALAPMLLLTGALAVGAPALAESSPALAESSPALAERTKALLGKYPAGPAYKGRSAPVNLRSHKNARTFRTRLRAAAKNSPNYAGHMIVAAWGCGTSCQMTALIDARTGKVAFGPVASAGYAYRPTSRLLIVNPPETIAEIYGDNIPEWLKTKYYLWKGGRLVELKQP